MLKKVKIKSLPKAQKGKSFKQTYKPLTKEQEDAAANAVYNAIIERARGETPDPFDAAERVFDASRLEINPPLKNDAPIEVSPGVYSTGNLMGKTNYKYGTLPQSKFYIDDSEARKAYKENVISKFYNKNGSIIPNGPFSGNYRMSPSDYVKDINNKLGRNAVNVGAPYKLSNLMTEDGLYTPSPEEWRLHQEMKNFEELAKLKEQKYNRQLEEHPELFEFPTYRDSYNPLAPDETLKLYFDNNGSLNYNNNGPLDYANGGSVSKLPKAAKGGVSYNQLAPMYMPNNMGLEGTKVRDTLQPVSRDEANLEAEKGETALLPNVGGLPAHYKIGGSRHVNGGTPLNLPDESFIFSDTKSMIIKDPKILAEFGETKPKTPAKIAKKYDINKYREILADPDMDQRSKETAEQMIANYNLKLAKLALYQESTKGFPEGIPTAALPFMSVNNIDPQQVLPLKPQQNPQEMNDEEQMYAEENPTEEQFVDEETMPEAQFGGSRLGNRLRQLFRRARQFDPRTGIYMHTDPQGRIYYVDGRGIPLPNSIQLPQGFMTPGTIINTPTVTTTTRTSGKKVVTESKPSKAKVDESKIKKEDDPNLKVGDYFRDKNGKLRKVTKSGYKNEVIRPSYSGKENYKPTYGSIEEDVKEANRIMEELKNKGFAEGNGKDGWIIRTGAADALTIRQKDFLTRVASYNKGKSTADIGAPGFKIKSQSRYKNNADAKKKDEKLKSKTGFYGFANPDMLEFRYWQATHPDGTYDDYENMDEDSKIENRKGMLALHGYDVKALGDKVKDPSKLYTQEFVTDPKNGLVVRNERVFKGKDAKTFRAEDDKAFGLDHLDAYTLPRYTDSEEVPDEYVPGEIPTEDLDVQNVPRPGSEWWLQDAIATAGAAGDLARVKKYTPWAPKVNPYIPEPTFFDPTRELANMTEQLAIGTEGAGAFSPAQAYNARFAEMQGQGAKSAADILGRYNNLNVGAANQFELTKANIINQTGMVNAEIAKNLYDANTIANQQYDNAKNQARQQLRQSYINAITNRAMTQAMNEAYGDHYMVDPSSGGFVNFTGKTADLQPSNPYSQEKAIAFRKLKDQFPDVDDQVLIKLMNGESDNDYADNYMKTLASMYPAQTGAGYGQYYQEG